MNARDVIEDLPIAEWHGPFDAALRTQAVDALEAGRVLLLAQLPFSVAADEMFLLSPKIMGSERKNISLDPATGSVGNTALGGAEAAKLVAMMQRFGDAAERLLHDLLPGYAPAIRVGLRRRRHQAARDTARDRATRASDPSSSQTRSALEMAGRRESTS